jgi:hypothetical protein
MATDKREDIKLTENEKKKDISDTSKTMSTAFLKEVVSTSQIAQNYLRFEAGVKNGTTSTDDIYSFVLQFFADANASMLELLKTFQYDGFEPRAFIRAFMAKGLSIRKDITEVLRDLILLLLYGVQQGTTVNARRASRINNKEAQAQILEIINAYDVRDGVQMVTGRKNNGASTSETITIGRILASFPHVIGQLVASGKIKPIVKSELIPLALQHNGAGALVPKLTEYNPLFELVVDYLVLVSKTLARKNGIYAGKSDADIRADVLNWATIARDGNALSNKDRINFLATHAVSVVVTPVVVK